MKTRTLAIVLGVALAASVAGNLFAATAAYTAFSGRDRIETRAEGRDHGDRHRSPRQLISALQPEAQDRVRQALRQAGMSARPDFQQSRELRRQAVAAASADPYDPARVKVLLDQARAAEQRGRERLEADALVILGTLTPTDRAAFARILDNRGRGGGHRHDRDSSASTQPPPSVGG